jgi:hypothetical protein
MLEITGSKGRMNWLDTHLESKEEAVVRDITNTVMMHYQGREGVEQAGNWKEVIGIESEMLRERGTRDYLTPGGLRRGVLTIYQGVLSIIMASEVPVQEPEEEQYKPGMKNQNYF